jgi:hypothetical protein
MLMELAMCISPDGTTSCEKMFKISFKPRQWKWIQRSFQTETLSPRLKATMERDVIQKLSQIIEPISQQSITSIGTVQVQIYLK